MTDKLKPVRCGCGGEARVQRVRTLKSHVLVVMCTKCEIATNYYTNEAEAITAWNRAMGAGKDEIAITKGTWMMTLDGFHCSVCFYKCETTALPDVCPHCGAKMKG